MNPNLLLDPALGEVVADRIHDLMRSAPIAVPQDTRLAWVGHALRTFASSLGIPSHTSAREHGVRTAALDGPEYCFLRRMRDGSRAWWRLTAASESAEFNSKRRRGQPAHSGYSLAFVCRAS